MRDHYHCLSPTSHSDAPPQLEHRHNWRRRHLSVLPVTFVAVAVFLGATTTPASDVLVQTNSMAVGEAKIIPATGSNVVIATEGIIRAIPGGPGKLVISAVKNGRTDLLVLNEAGQATEKYAMIVSDKNEVHQELYKASLDDFRKIIKDIVGEHSVQFEVLVGPSIHFDGTNVIAVPKPVLFIHGSAKDEIQADAIRSVASRFYGVGDYGSTSQQSQPSTTNVSTRTVTDLGSEPSIVDQMTLASYHQIRIRVQVVEVKLEALKRKGVRYSDFATWGIAPSSSLSLSELGKGNTGELIAQRMATGLVVPTGGSSSSGSLTPAFQATLNLLISDGYARLLSEPTLVTKSGKEASFLAGGRLILQQTTANTSTAIEVPFGVFMTIKPSVDREDHVDIEVRTDASERPVPIVTGSRDYIINARSSTTKLRLVSGDTLVLSGLLGNEMRNAITKVPWLGQIPVLGALFRSKEWQHNESELLFFITPELIRETPAADAARQIRTPAMQQWHYIDSHKDILPDPNSHASPDNDVHDLLGLPHDRMHYEEPAPAPVVTPQSAPAKRPAPKKKPLASAPPASPQTPPPTPANDGSGRTNRKYF